MRKDKYLTFKEWQKDLVRVNENPNDKHLLDHVLKCIDNSSPLVKREIKEYLSSSVLDTNPMEILNQISKEHPESLVIVKSVEDVWFYC